MTLSIGYRKVIPQLGCDPAEEWIAKQLLTGAVLKTVILGMDVTEDADIETTEVDAAVVTVELPGVDGQKGVLHKLFATTFCNQNKNDLDTQQQQQKDQS